MNLKFKSSVINVSTITFAQFNVSLLNKSINLYFKDSNFEQ